MSQYDTSRAPETAASMITKYGPKRAEEFAHGYAVGSYFNQTAEGKTYWLAVVAEIQAIARKMPVYR